MAAAFVKAAQRLASKLNEAELIDNLKLLNECRFPLSDVSNEVSFMVIYMTS